MDLGLEDGCAASKRSTSQPWALGTASADEAVPVPAPPALPGGDHPETGGSGEAGTSVQGLHLLGLFALSRA